MLGNDVVDLGDRETEALHPRFDSRVFTDRERLLLGAQPHPRRWLLWSAKEAAFKAARRLDPTVRFHPRAFEVAIDASGAGIVRFGTRELAARVTLRGPIVHALVATDLSGVIASVRRIPEGDDPGCAARALAVERIGRTLGVDPRSLSVETLDRMPWLRGVRFDAPLSLSHHGRWAAFAFHVATSAARAA